MSAFAQLTPEVVAGMYALGCCVTVAAVWLVGLVIKWGVNDMRGSKSEDVVREHSGRLTQDRGFHNGVRVIGLVDVREIEPTDWPDRRRAS